MSASGVLPSNLGAGVGAMTYAASVVYAGFWRRFAALFIDSILVWVITFVIGFVIGFVITVISPGSSDAATAIAGLVGFLIGILYFPLMESSAAQATLGKKALGIIVTDLTGNRIGFGRAVGRYFAKILSSLIFCIGYIMAAFTERKQALHDIIAGTLVIRGQPSGS